MNRIALVLVVGALACGHKDSSPVAQPPVVMKPYVMPKDAPVGLDLVLSNGKQGAPAFDHAKLAPATKLSDAEAQQLLARAPALQMQTDDQQAFALRPSSTPPPRTGDTIKTTFPPAPSSLLPPPANDTGKDLRVLRFMPTGEVPIAPELSVTFSQPMVAVTSQSDAATVVPVKLTPQPKGKWRWIGTRTALFDPDPRFPQATTYQVEVPAGTKSANGGVLKDAVKFSFETPAPKVVAEYPGSYQPQRLDVPMFLMFDQKIDPQAVLAKLQLTTANGWDSKPRAIQLLDQAAIAKDKQLTALAEAAHKEDHDGRWLAFRSTAPLPIDSEITITVPKGTPSLEGPNPTKDAQTYSFHTYAPLKVEETACSPQCPPDSPLWLRFNNPLDEEAFDESWVTVQPEIPNAKIIAQGELVEVMGPTKPRTTYTVTVGRKLEDDFGQLLGREETRTFKVGDAYPTFYGPSGLVVLDPASTRPTLDFFSTNYDSLKVKLYAVEPRDLQAFGTYVENVWNHDHPPAMPGRKVFDSLIKVPGGKNELVETHIDLAPALKGGFGHVAAIVEPYPWKETYDPPRMIVWAQATKLAVDAHVDGDNLVAFATELGTAAPAANVQLEIRPYGIKAVTDAKGMATLPLSDAQKSGAHYLLASRGDDTAFVAESWSDYGSWYKHARGSQLAWYVVDDRKLYRPGEEVSLKGWLRTIDYGKNGDVGPSTVNEVTYKVIDAVGNQIGAGSAKVDALGGFDTKFTLPKTPNLGDAQVQFEAPGSSYSHPLQIEEFRRPEFEVAAHGSSEPMVVGGSGDVIASAKYFAGGPLPGAQVTWYVTASQTTFTPPNRDEYTFGQWRPWWGYRSWVEDEGDEDSVSARAAHSPGSWSWEAKTDGAGEHDLHFDFKSIKPAAPYSVTANATVYDVNRQAQTASAALIVHPSTYYVGVKTKRTFVEKGSPFDLDVIGVDLEGKSVPGAKIDVKSVRIDWEYKKGRYHKKEVDPQTCAVVAAIDPKHCSLKTDKGGTYELTATIIDPAGRPNETKITYWVAGGEEPPMRDVALERVNLIPDKKDYAPGNTAEIMVQSPWFPAEGVVTWRRSGMVKVERITMTGPTTSLEVPITDAMTPNLTVQVDLTGMAVRTNDAGDPDPKLPKRPAYASGSLDLQIPPKQRALAVTVTPAASKLSPGQGTKLTVEVKDAQGKPVADAETCVIVVDEAVLALTGYQFPDPLGSFYPERDAGTADYYERGYVKLAKPQVKSFTAGGPRRRVYRGAATGGGGPGGGDMDGAMADEAEMPVAAAAPPAAEPARAEKKLDDRKEAENKPMEQTRVVDKGYKAGGKDSGGEQQQAQAIAIRSNFNPLAAFAPVVKTGADGRATIDIKVPDNLTRYRVVALAVAGSKQYGKGESNVTARLPLMVRPSPPRFLNFGDTFKLPVVVQNQTDAPMTVKLAARTANASLTDGIGRQVTVPANDRVEVQFPASAMLAGTARFQVVGAAGGGGGAMGSTDAATFELPVWTPATTEAFATYGVIDSGATKQPVALPGKVVEQFGGLEVTTSSTNLQSLTDAMLYLVHYPFECAEQRSSRILAIAALRDVLTAFKTKDMPTAAELEHSVDVDIEHLSQMQNYDGGFAFWDRGYPSEPYLSVFVANALSHAKAKGFTVPQNILDRARVYLRDIEAHYPSFYPVEVRRAISAYALYTRKQMGDLDIAKGQKLLRDAGGPEKLSMEADGWLLGLFAGNPTVATERKALLTYALNHVSETAGAANFTTGYGDGNYLLLASDRRVDGVMLESLIQEQKDSDLIPKLVTGLLAHRTRGRWENTQENAFVLLALDLYFQTYEKVTPDFVARVWLGNDYAGDHTFKGRSTDYAEIDIPMKDVATHDKSDLTIQKDGAGRLYYRIGMKYAPADLKIDPADYGFVVERRYEGADDPKDVTRGADGTWHIRAGSRVRVRLTMVNENRRYHVALVDPMPAGLEAMNPALATTGPLPEDPAQQQARGRYWWWTGPWYEHQNLRDERVEAFSSLLWEGVHEYSYVARATTPGQFIVPPPKAEEMYMPETFGRGGSDRVIVE